MFHGKLKSGSGSAEINGEQALVREGTWWITSRGESGGFRTI